MKRIVVRTGLLATVSLFMLTVSPAPAAADAPGCRARVTREAGVFAKKRGKQVLRCATAGCASGELDSRLSRLKTRSLKKLNRDCTGLNGADLELGSTCPDPSGQCTQQLDTTGDLTDCLFCLIAGTIDPLVDRLNGQPGAGAEACGGCSATACADGLFCDSPPGHCENDMAVGHCTEPPSVCPDVYEPVCGCDGTTYGNDCERQQASVGLFHPGPCVSFCGDGSPEDCPTGTVCEGLPGHCDAATNEGICVPVPNDCTGLDLPECGCDDVTYATPCERLAAGVRLAHPGPCTSECSDLVPCDTGSFCEHPPGTCGDASAPGFCVPLPSACPDNSTAANIHPVCGCDGADYGNPCEAMMAGVSIAHPGACDSVCGGLAGIACSDGQACVLPPGSCNTADLQGHCVEVPQACPDVYFPVCGCDDVTYGNDCELLVAGAQMAHPGPCMQHCVPGGSGCATGEACVAPPGDCSGAVGMCIPAPEVCPQFYWPVCGCDNVTYNNHCEALAAGAGIAYEGECGNGPPCDPLTDPGCTAGP
ncbi:MAG: hypothetical protein H8E45_13170 [Proteobacteria bacterium]|nr:hypothetical protein [Pseudomonadota bacterium]